MAKRTVQDSWGVRLANPSAVRRMRSLREAIDAHASGNIEAASQFYEAALVEGCQEALLYQNLGAIYRQKGEIEKAKKLFDRGLEIHVCHPGILANRVNILKHDEPIKAVADLLVILRQEPEQIEAWLNLLFILFEQGCFAWSIVLLKEALMHHPDEPRLWYRALAVSLALSSEQEGHESREPRIMQLIDRLAEDISSEKKSDLLIIMAGYGQIRRDDKMAEKYYKELTETLASTKAKSTWDAQERRKNYHIASWNYSAYLLKQQNFELGWGLYDHGLQAPCETNPIQIWQRALIKPFQTTALPLWKGESLDGKKLLVLAEQGIGDTMMFASLLPALEEEAAEICLFTSDRLCKAYSSRYTGRTRFAELEDVSIGRIKASQFDYQIPIGSICRFRFTKPGSYAPRTPIIKPSRKDVREIYRKKYGIAETEKLIGISWAGGGGTSRKREKSIAAEQLVNLLANNQGCRYVSLQYGEAKEMQRLLKKQQIDVIVDGEVDAIHGFPDWLDQVAACDAVVSVANTTIHASGSLGLPTMCLLGDKTDWRWLNERSIRRSYWYESVQITRQASNGSWEEAIQYARDWIAEGCPLRRELPFMG